MGASDFQIEEGIHASICLRQLVNSIGKLVWIAKLDASKGDIEDRFYQKS
jgi:hypothetical protein